ncbi:hypothetical protein [Pseudonocardia sp.]|uniref:hypothetical protein n=1 Tax=Pseudonocardia sp. TaxID=60912 RepID=UPI00260F8AF6|nr:hypothetical protein [Pseudonocardia sp.]
MTKQRRVAVASPQTRLAMARRRSGVRADRPHLAPADLERARVVHRAQLRSALLAVGWLAVLIIGLPLLLAAFPALDDVPVLGVPLSWLAVAVLPYAVLVALAGWALRRAERTERTERRP